MKEALPRSVEFVTVGCKLPHGLHLDMYTPKGRQRHTLKGTNSSKVIGGFGLTQVPKEFWEAWFKQNGELDMVKKELVWAYPSEAGAEKKALEMAELRHGSEPLIPPTPGMKPEHADPRLPRNLNVTAKVDKDE